MAFVFLSVSLASYLKTSLAKRANTTVGMGLTDWKQKDAEQMASLTLVDLAKQGGMLTSQIGR